jgi:hypothetical protein
MSNEKIELKKGKRYLVESDRYARYPSRNAFTVLELAKTSVRVRWDSGAEVWIERRRFERFGISEAEYEILEELADITSFQS